MGFIDTLKKLFGVNGTATQARPTGAGWKWDTAAIRKAHLYTDALPDLTGSPKQIAWAQQIRDPQVIVLRTRLYSMSRGSDAALVPIALPIVTAHLGHTEARYWIATREEFCENLVLEWKLKEIASQQERAAAEEAVRAQPGRRPSGACPTPRPCGRQSGGDRGRPGWRTGCSALGCHAQRASYRGSRV